MLTEHQLVNLSGFHAMCGSALPMTTTRRPDQDAGGVDRSPERAYMRCGSNSRLRLLPYRFTLHIFLMNVEHDVLQGMYKVIILPHIFENATGIPSVFFSFSFRKMAFLLKPFPLHDENSTVCFWYFCFFKFFLFLFPPVPAGRRKSGPQASPRAGVRALLPGRARWRRAVPKRRSAFGTARAAASRRPEGGLSVGPAHLFRGSRSSHSVFSGCSGVTTPSASSAARGCPGGGLHLNGLPVLR